VFGGGGSGASENQGDRGDSDGGPRNECGLHSNLPSFGCCQSATSGAPEIDSVMSNPMLPRSGCPRKASPWPSGYPPNRSERNVAPEDRHQCADRRTKSCGV
jgi:hypothetical protein